MSGTALNSNLVRFGVFEVDLRDRELRKSGVRLKVQDQPFQVLSMLLERPGEVVSREELQKRLWPDDTFVDFDLSLNSAVKKLRNVLGDDSDNPKFIETFYRRGYRFVAPVKKTEAEAIPAQLPGNDAAAAKSTAPRPLITRRSGTVFGLVCTAVLLIAAFFFWWSLPDAPRVTSYMQITHDGRAKGFQSFVTDGTRLYTRESPSEMVPVEVAVNGGDTSVLSLPFGAAIDDIAPDGSALLLRATEDTSNDYAVWKLPLPSGSPMRVGDLLAHWTAWSSRTGTLLFSKNEGIFVAKDDGTDARKLAATDGLAEDLRVSPDGSTLRFTLVKNGTSALWEVQSDGTGLRPLLPHWDGRTQECCGNWTPDRKYFVFQRLWNGRNDLWAMPEHPGWFGDAQPVRLTDGPLDFTLPLPSKDGRKIFTVGMQRRAELARYVPKVGFTPYFGGLSAEGLAFSLDGRWIAYVSVPDGALWRSKVDGSDRLQLTNGSILRAVMPSWSPDGRQVLFTAQTTSTGPRTFVISAEGGLPQELIPGAAYGFGPVWSADGKSVFVTLHDPFRHSGGISVFDVTTKTLSDLPGSENLFAPRSSPDGRFLTATSIDSRKLMLFDRSAAQWTELVDVSGLVVAYPSWSHDGKYVYFEGVLPDDRVVFRVRVSDRKLERVVSLKGIRQYWGDAFEWVGLAPDDSVLFNRDVSSQEIYALDWQIR
jgi:DNA-binding winged helix-turn-helix (wHTH) protein/Tol biopolymer transport system component